MAGNSMALPNCSGFFATIPMDAAAVSPWDFPEISPHDPYRQAGCQDEETCLRVDLRRSAAQKAYLGKGEEAHQQSIDTLCTGQELEHQYLGKFARVLCHDPRRSLSGDAYTEG